jgi:hypothetical protein
MFAVAWQSFCLVDLVRKAYAISFNLSAVFPTGDVTWRNAGARLPNPAATAGHSANDGGCNKFGLEFLPPPGVEGRTESIKYVLGTEITPALGENVN